MITESKVVEEKSCRYIHVSKRSVSGTERWVFVQADDETYEIALYEKHFDQLPNNSQEPLRYAWKAPESGSNSLELTDIPLPDDLVHEIAKHRRSFFD